MADIKEMQKLRDKGLTYQEIGNKLGCSEQWVYKTFKKIRPKEECPIKTRAERSRIRKKIHEFCFSESMATKGCANCPLNDIDVCGEAPEMVRMRKADKMIDELMGCRNDEN